MNVKLSGEKDKREVERARPLRLTASDAKQLGDAIYAAITAFVVHQGGNGPGLADPKQKVSDAPPSPAAIAARVEEGAMAAAAADFIGKNFEEMYQAIKRRLLDELRVDPIMVRLLSEQPEILVEIEPRVVKLDTSTLRGRLARLMAADYFATERPVGTVRKELARTGNDPGGGGTLKETLDQYAKDGFLTREGEGYRLAPGVKVSEQRKELTT